MSLRLSCCIHVLYSIYFREVSKKMSLLGLWMLLPVLLAKHYSLKSSLQDWGHLDGEINYPLLYLDLRAKLKITLHYLPNWLWSLTFSGKVFQFCHHTSKTNSGWKGSWDTDVYCSVAWSGYSPTKCLVCFIFNFICSNERLTFVKLFTVANLHLSTLI